MKALRPVASRLGLRSSTARRGKPLRKRKATTQAVEGNLGGFCVGNHALVFVRLAHDPRFRPELRIADSLSKHLIQLSLGLPVYLIAHRSNPVTVRRR